MFSLFVCVFAVQLCKYTLHVGLSGVTREYPTRVYVRTYTNIWRNKCLLWVFVNLAVGEPSQRHQVQFGS